MEDADRERLEYALDLVEEGEADAATVEAIWNGVEGVDQLLTAIVAERERDGAAPVEDDISPVLKGLSGGEES